MRQANATICALVLFIVAGCSTAPLVKDSSQEEKLSPPKTIADEQTVQRLSKLVVLTGAMQSVQEPKSQPDPAKPINLTPLSKYTDEWQLSTSAGASFSDAYTRLLILGEVLADGGQPNSSQTTPLLYKERAWWLRALLGQEFSINLTAKVAVGAFETTVPLATIGHQSNSDGEQWSRVIHHAKSNFPLFLVKADGSTSVPVVKLSVNGTKSYSSRGAAAAVQVALGVARATAQPVSVVTRLSEQSNKDKARAIDTAISKLFSSGVTEEHWTDRDLRLWSVDDNRRPRGVVVDFAIPSDEQDWNSPAQKVGRWTITFDYPRPSIFSDWRICNTDTIPRCARTRADAEKHVHKEIDASEVLNYVLWNGDNNLGTIRAFVSQQDWYVSAQTALATPGTAATTASSLCRRIANEITGLGLNGFDARIVVWAIANGMPLPAGAPNFANVNDCKAAIVPIESLRT